MSAIAAQLDLSPLLDSSSNDIKNSISVLIDLLETTVAETDPASFDAYRKLAQMLYETRRINGKLVQLHTLHQLDRNRYPFNPERVLLSEFADEVAMQHARQLEASNVRFEIDAPAGLYWDFDRELINGIIDNAVNNGIHYTLDSLRLTISASDGWLEILIEDNGEGFPQAMLDENAAAMRGENVSAGAAGLWLHLSTLIARLHRNRERHGEFFLANRATGGSRLVIRLP